MWAGSCSMNVCSAPLAEGGLSIRSLHNATHRNATGSIEQRAGTGNDAVRLDEP